jgi:uncharacterized membrane protein
MDDRRLETIIGRLLQTGVLMAAATVLSGGILYLVRHHSEPAHFHNFVAGGPAIRTLAGIVQSAAHLNGEGLIQIGLVLLILTPVARVAMAVVGFFMERDRMYGVVSLIVLFILALSLIRAV